MTLKISITQYSLFQRQQLQCTITQRYSYKAPQQAYRRLPQCRYASASATKPIRLEKPTKFVPPSHGKRLRQHIPRHYGPELTQTQKTEQATKKYPNMMPPEGTFMYWFLTNRGIHSFISLGTLVLLASITAYENWKRATAFREQLPSAKDFLSHPIASCSQAIEVYKLDVARTSAETAERRKRDVDDAQKRSIYRRAHGLEKDDDRGFGVRWIADGNEKILGPSLEVDRPVSETRVTTVPDEPAQRGMATSTSGTQTSAYVDWEGKKRPVKRWLGIW